MTSHTPGKWRVFAGPGTTNNGSRRTRVWTANGDHVIADCSASETLSLAAQEANARAIAALPDVLEALAELLDCPYDIDPATIARAGIDAAPEQVVGNMSVALVRIRKARAAIAAATVGAPPMIPSESIIWRIS